MSTIYPLDIIRCRLQAQAIKNENEEDDSKSDLTETNTGYTRLEYGDYGPNTIFSNKFKLKRSPITQCISDILQEEGINGFYKAMGTILFQIMISFTKTI